MNANWEAYQIFFKQRFDDFIWGILKYNIIDTIMGQRNFCKHEYL